MQRTIVIKCLPGFPAFDISEIMDPAGDEEYTGLLKELNEFRNLMFCFRLIHFKDKIPNINLNIRNREKQLFKPLLRLFQGTNTFGILRPVISEYIRERRMSKSNSYHAFLYRVVRDLIKAQGLELQSSNIWDFIKMNLEYKEIPYKPQSIETVEFGVLSQKGVTQTLKDVFHAEPPKHKGSTRNLVFSQHVLDRMKDTYEMDIEIEVDFETHTDMANFMIGAHGAHGAHSGSASIDFDHSDSKENGENIEQTNKNYEESVIESNNNNDGSSADTPLHSYNVPQAPQAPQTPDPEDLTEEDFRLEPNPVEIVNVQDPRGCDFYIGRRWKKAYGNGHNGVPAGSHGYFGNPFVMDKDGGHDGTREQVLAKYKEWLFQGAEVVNGKDPVEVRRMALNELPYHWRWGCHCKPEPCHGDVLLEWLIEQLNGQRRSDY
jgi:hypothetical protein